MLRGSWRWWRRLIRAGLLLARRRSRRWWRRRRGRRRRIVRMSGLVVVVVTFPVTFPCVPTGVGSGDEAKSREEMQDPHGERASLVLAKVVEVDKLSSATRLPSDCEEFRP
jgi:hypothetical protein